MEPASAQLVGPARLRVSVIADALVFTMLFSASPALFSLLLPRELSIVGAMTCFVYAWWRGALPLRLVGTLGLSILLPSVAWYVSRRIGMDFQEQMLVVIGAMVTLLVAKTLRRPKAIEPS
jgi:hypothetical protein